MPAFEDKPQSYYETPPKKRSGIKRYIFIGIGVLVLLGMGSCVWMFTGLFQKMAERQTATKLFVEQILAEGLPDVGDDLYYNQTDFSQSAINTVNTMINDYGAPISIAASSCNVNVSANTNSAKDGTFANCETAIEYEVTSGVITTRWKMDGEEWKLFYFYTHYDNALEPTPEEPAPTVHDGD